MRTAPHPRGTPSDGLAFERLVFFSDAVFAIAITLLVIEIRLPEGTAIADGRALLAALSSLLPRYLGFLVSFVVVGSFWLSHHRLFRSVRGFDERLLLLDLLFLLFVAFIPFPTAVLGRYGYLPAAGSTSPAATACWSTGSNPPRSASRRSGTRRRPAWCSPPSRSPGCIGSCRSSCGCPRAR
jgi:hypothetical protein